MMPIGDLEEALTNLEQKRRELKQAIADLKMAKTKVVTLPGNPGDILAGTLTRMFLQSVSPSLIRSLEKIGIAPGKYS